MCVTHLSLNRSQVTLHALETTLQGHDTSQVITKVLSGFNKTSFVFDPCGCLYAFNVIGLDLTDCNDGITTLLQKYT